VFATGFDELISYILTFPKEEPLMAELILHHYPNSPFAEKIRLILGAKKLNWMSVIQPAIMPKPDLVALTGGHRRIPALQIGADMICDTALICDVLEDLAPTPSLYRNDAPNGQAGQARIIAQWADGSLFAASMAHNFQPKGAAALFEGAPPTVGQAFAEDRKAMRGANPRMLPNDATGTYKIYLARIAQLLGNKPYLLGDTISLADFSCYHSLWFTRRLAAIAQVLDTHANLLPWMDRIASIGHGKFEKLSTAEALAIAARAGASTHPIPSLHDNQVFQDEHGIALGSAVSITAESFGLEQSTGTLLAATANRFTISRTDPQAGSVRVHFPRLGFNLKAQAPS
jgi:glutathione S-transferase